MREFNSFLNEKGHVLSDIEGYLIYLIKSNNKLHTSHALKLFKEYEEYIFKNIREDGFFEDNETDPFLGGYYYMQGITYLMNRLFCKCFIYNNTSFIKRFIAERDDFKDYLLQSFYFGMMVENSFISSVFDFACKSQDVEFFFEFMDLIRLNYDKINYEKLIIDCPWLNKGDLAPHPILNYDKSNLGQFFIDAQVYILSGGNPGLVKAFYCQKEIINAINASDKRDFTLKNLDFIILNKDGNHNPSFIDACQSFKAEISSKRSTTL